MSTTRTFVREISPGAFRVNGVRGRTVMTGRVVTAASAQRNPRTTGTESTNGRSATISRRSALG